MHPLTPPISAGTEDSKSDTSSQLQSLGMVPHQPPTTHPLDAPLVDENSWDPTRIIKYVILSNPFPSEIVYLLIQDFI